MGREGTCKMETVGSKWEGRELVRWRLLGASGKGRNLLDGDCREQVGREETCKMETVGSKWEGRELVRWRQLGASGKGGNL